MEAVEPGDTVLATSGIGHLPGDFEFTGNYPKAITRQLVNMQGSGKETGIAALTVYPGKVVDEDDEAMATQVRTIKRFESPQVENKKYGGIDLTPAHMNLQTQNLNGEINFHIDPAQLAQLQDASGFVPVIVGMQPMASLRNFLDTPV